MAETRPSGAGTAEANVIPAPGFQAWSLGSCVHDVVISYHIIHAKVSLGVTKDGLSLGRGAREEDVMLHTAACTLW